LQFLTGWGERLLRSPAILHSSGNRPNNLYASLHEVMLTRLANKCYPIALVERLTNLDVLRAVSEMSEGVVPTVRELGEHLGISGPSVHRRLEALVSEGLLSRRANQPRTLALTAAGKAALRVR
jgi:DNA-binding MarR family transcriptional regulator